MKFMSIVLGTLALFAAGNAAATNRPANYVTICSESKACPAVAANTNVAFGRANKFTYKLISGSFVCSEATFGAGSKVAGGTNECSVPRGTASSSASSSSSSRSSSSSSATSSSASSASSSAQANSCQPGSTITNATIDCGGAVVGTSCAGGAESQKPVFTLVNATIRNVRIKAGAAADGIHCVAGNCRMENVVWEDVCEDAATLKDAGVSMTISGGSANAADDKVFQHNSKNSTVNIENFTTYNRIGKLYRSCGDCTGNGGPRYVNINNVSMTGSNGAVAGINRNYGDVAKIRNLKVRNWSFPDGNAEVCLVHIGVEKGSGSSSKIGIEWGTKNCDVTAADVTRL